MGVGREPALVGPKLGPKERELGNVNVGRGRDESASGQRQDVSPGRPQNAGANAHRLAQDELGEGDLAVEDLQQLHCG